MKKLVGLFASVALMTSGAALAFEAQEQQEQQSDVQSGQGGSGMQEQPGMGGSQALGGNEVTGQVIKSDKKSVFLKSQEGAVVQLKVDKQTQFTDPNMKSAKDLKPGTELRASFDVKGTDNIATSIQPSLADTGGSGDVLSPDTGINQGGTMPEDSGGSGMDQSGSDIGGEEKSY